MFSKKPADSIRTANNWIGAIYYRIIEKKTNGKTIYTLLGFDDFTVNANKKWMDILSFDEQGQPVFGGPYFSFRNDSAKSYKNNTVRFNIEYKKEASTTFNYDFLAEYDCIRSFDLRVRRAGTKRHLCSGRGL